MSIRQTNVEIRGEAFYINGQPTYQGRTWRGMTIEGLLLNARLVQGIFHDRNPETCGRWAYLDTGVWDAERNTREFIAAMPEWRRHGLLAFTINLQGGSPQGYSREQPWHNSAIEADGSLRADYLDRLARIIDTADALGMVVILGIFYFGQDQRLVDEAAVIRAVDNAVQWVLDQGYRNVLIEVNNECNGYTHPVLKPERVHELIARVQSHARDGYRLAVGTSYYGGIIPGENVVRASNYLLLHGNGVGDPAHIAEMVRQTRAVPGYRPMPILFNEDDHFNFEQPQNNLLAAISEYASWGYFDPGASNYQDGYQCPPVNWGINTERKRGFFALLHDMTTRDAAALTFPGATWQTADPAAHGFDADRLTANLQPLPGNIVMIHNGVLVHARGDIDRPIPLYSVGKSLCALLFGRLLHAGQVTLEDAVPGSDLPSGILASFRQLLSMTSDYGLLPHEPGKHYAYNNMGVNFYAQHLADRYCSAAAPLEVMHDAIWRIIGQQDACDYTGHWGGWGGGFHYSTRDLARIGLLVLAGGWWNGQSLIPAVYIDALYANQISADATASTDSGIDRIGSNTMFNQQQFSVMMPGCYSFGWWIEHGIEAQERPVRAISARGALGNKILVCPDHSIVIAVTAEEEESPKACEYLRAVLAAMHAPGKADPAC